MTEILVHKETTVSPVIPPLFSQETLDSLHALGTVYAKIHRRLIAEGYTIKDGVITKPDSKKQS